MLEREHATCAFHWLQAPRPEIASHFTAGQLDLAIDIPAFARPDLGSQRLFSDRYVCVLRRDHPRASGRFTLAHFLALRHIAVSTRRKGKGVVDVALGRIGQRLTPAMRLPHFQPAFHAVMASDHALVAPFSLAQRYDVAIRELPVDTAELDLMLFWRRDALGDLGLAWARDKLVEAAAQLKRPPPGRGGGRVSTSSRMRCTMVLVCPAIWSLNGTDAWVSGQPSTESSSFTPIGTPPNGLRRCRPHAPLTWPAPCRGSRTRSVHWRRWQRTSPATPRPVSGVRHGTLR